VLAEGPGCLGACHCPLPQTGRVLLYHGWTPLLYTFDDEGQWRFILSYFHNPEPYVWDGENADYMDPSYKTNAATYEWQWAASDIINAVIGAGLRLDFFNEYEALSTRSTRR
jgi:hypothetical protein